MPNTAAVTVFYFFDDVEKYLLQRILFQKSAGLPMKIGECWYFVLTLACHLTEEQKIVQHIVPFLINVFLGKGSISSLG